MAEALLPDTDAITRSIRERGTMNKLPISKEILDRPGISVMMPAVCWEYVLNALAIKSFHDRTQDFLDLRGVNIGMLIRLALDRKAR